MTQPPPAGSGYTRAPARKRQPRGSEWRTGTHSTGSASQVTGQLWRPRPNSPVGQCQRRVPQHLSVTLRGLKGTEGLGCSSRSATQQGQEGGPIPRYTLSGKEGHREGRVKPAGRRRRGSQASKEQSGDRNEAPDYLPNARLTPSELYSIVAKNGQEFPLNRSRQRTSEGWLQPQSPSQAFVEMTPG